MTLFEIRQIPKEMHLRRTGGIHESVLRSYHIVAKVVELLERKTDHETILEIINDLYTNEVKP